MRKAAIAISAWAVVLCGIAVMSFVGMWIVSALAVEVPEAPTSADAPRRVPPDFISERGYEMPRAGAVLFIGESVEANGEQFGSLTLTRGLHALYGEQALAALAVLLDVDTPVEGIPTEAVGIAYERQASIAVGGLKIGRLCQDSEAQTFWYLVPGKDGCLYRGTDAVRAMVAHWLAARKQPKE